MSFESELTQVFHKVVLKKIAEGSWIDIDYVNRVKLDKSIFAELVASIDMERVKTLLVEKIEDKLADKIFNSLASEVGNDTKSIMCNTELREDFRVFLRNKMKAAAKGLRDAE